MVIEATKKFPPISLVKYQCSAAASANVIVLCHGIFNGWCSPVISMMLSAQLSPLTSGEITLYDASWIGSILYLGSVVGTCLFMFSLKYLKLKTVMGLLALPNLVAWIIVLFGNHPAEVIVARFLSGISSGGAFLCVPLFIADIANKNIRGILGSLFMTTSALGVLLGLIIASYVPYRVIPFIFLVPGLIYTGSILMCPESPQSLLMVNKSQEAERSFRFYNFGNNQRDQLTPDLKLEFEQLTIANRPKDDESDRVTIRTILTGNTLKGISIGIFLSALAMFGGVYCINMYSISIFTETGTYVDPRLSAISISVIQIFGTSAGLVCVDRWGRKKLLSMSCLGSAISLFAFAIFAYLNQSGYDLVMFHWVPIASMGIYLFANNAGVLSLPFVIIAESLPQKTRRIGSTICSFCFSGFAFTHLKIFPILSHYWGLYIVISMCGAVCLVGFFFALFVLEETKGKALNE